MNSKRHAIARGMFLVVVGLLSGIAYAQKESKMTEQKPVAGLAPLAFAPLPLGAVRPEGWLRNQLRIQADGLSGHLDEFWPDIRDSGWIGGAAEGWERAPYWLDGVVPLAYLLDDETLKGKVTHWMDYILTHRREDGWLGPAGSKGYRDYDTWPRFVLLKAMAQYYEATGDERVIDCMRRFLEKTGEVLTEKPLFDWGMFRWMDLVWSIHWLYARTGDEWLLDLAAKAHAQGFDWKAHYADFKHAAKVPQNECRLETHGVNNAMAVKAYGVWFRQSGDASDRDAVYQTIRMLDEYHGQITGVFTGDEHYAGKCPSQGTELCLVVEYLFSLETLVSTLGDAALADRMERIAFNTLPATFSPDMWAHQYDQQANQVLCRIADDRVFASNGPDANIFGLEPNYGCCTANFSQGWPKFGASLWMRSRDGGLAAAAYAPCRVETEIGNTPAVVRVETEYPFRETVVVAVEAEATFPIHLRVPSWAEGATAAVGEAAAEPITPGTFVRIERDWSQGQTITLRFPMKPRIERGFQNSVAILRGPLVFSLKMGEYWKQVRGALPHADWEVYPTTAWNYGLRLDLAVPEKSVAFHERPVGLRPFSPEGAPVEAVVQGRLVPEWVLEHNAAGPVPASPVESVQPPVPLTLIPYGCTDLRITEFPLLGGS